MPSSLLSFTTTSSSPPTISLQEATTIISTTTPPMATYAPPTTAYPPSIPSPIPINISLSLPSTLQHSGLVHLPIHPLPPGLPRSPLLSISEVTNTLLDHNCNQ